MARLSGIGNRLVWLRLLIAAALAVLFALPVSSYAQGNVELFNFARPLDAVQVSGENAYLPSIRPESDAKGEVLRRAIFNPGARPSFTLTPQNTSWDWSRFNAMGLRVQNAMDWALTLDVQIDSGEGKRLATRIALPAGPAQTLLIPLTATSPRVQGMRAGLSMPWYQQGRRLLLAESVEGDVELARVSSVTISIPAPSAAQQLLLGRVSLTDQADLTLAYQHIVDAYGQYSRSSWPGKIKTDAQLRQGAASEQKQLQAWLAARPAQDEFGGWTGGKSFSATGFFRTEKRAGRWFLVSPRGNPFFSLGVNSVTANQSQTYIEGRESMFAALPMAGEPLAAFYGHADDRGDSGANRGRAFASGRWYDFYRANLARSNATEQAQGWRERTQTRLQAWGFNTLGNWSDEDFAQAPRMPYSIALSIQGDYASISTGVDWWGGMPDPFDSRFAMAVERAIAIATRDHRDDPWLLGYYADNELAWAGPAEDPQSRYALAYATLRAQSDVPAKGAFVKQLQDKYRNVASLSKAWGIEIKTWAALEESGFVAPSINPQYPAIARDMQEFLRLFADTYFKTIADSLRWHAPNHLLLGGRFSASIPEAVQACAQYCDLLSFNFYTREPQQGYDFAVLRALDKPLLVTEFHFGSRDRGPLWGGVAQVYSEEQRGPAYGHFLTRALAEPQIVGVHWFQYLDQPVTGRLLDGENGHLGLVAITDRPWTGFVKTVRKANLAVAAQLLEQARQHPPSQSAAALNGQP